MCREKYTSQQRRDNIDYWQNGADAQEYVVWKDFRNKMKSLVAWMKRSKDKENRRQGGQKDYRI